MIDSTNIKGEPIKLIDIQEIVNIARERAERHMIAEVQLRGGLNCLYNYPCIENSEIASFEEGTKWMYEKLTGKKYV